MLPRTASSRDSGPHSRAGCHRDVWLRRSPGARRSRPALTIPGPGTKATDRTRSTSRQNRGGIGFSSTLTISSGWGHEVNRVTTTRYGTPKRSSRRGDNAVTGEDGDSSWIARFDVCRARCGYRASVHPRPVRLSVEGRAAPRVLRPSSSRRRRRLRGGEGERVDVHSIEAARTESLLRVVAGIAH